MSSRMILHLFLLSTWQASSAKSQCVVANFFIWVLDQVTSINLNPKLVASLGLEFWFLKSTMLDIRVFSRLLGAQSSGPKFKPWSQFELLTSLDGKAFLIFHCL